MVSAPALPSSRLSPSLPSSTFFRALPVPSMSPLPVRVRFSRLAPSTKLTELSTVSFPPLASSSVTVSPALSTM